MPLDRIRFEAIAAELENAGNGIPRVVPTPKGARQFIFPNGTILRFDLAPGQYGQQQGPHINLEVPSGPNHHIYLLDKSPRDEERPMTYDFNMLERRAQELIDAGRAQDAIGIYLFMADGDPSLDGGYLGKRLGECYEAIGDLHAAKYWYGRAVEENPVARRDCAAARERLAGVTIDELLESPASSPPRDLPLSGEPLPSDVHGVTDKGAAIVGTAQPRKDRLPR